MASTNAKNTGTSCKQVQAEAIEILKVFQENMKNDVYISLQKAINHELIVKNYASMDINAWNRITGFNVAAESLFQHFKRYSYLFQDEEKEEKKDNSDNNMKGFKTVYVTTLPVYKGSDEQHHRYSKSPLHLKTNWDVTKDHLMYQLEFRGHIYGTNEIIFAIAVGYVYNKENKLRNTNIKHICDGALVSSYVSKDNKVAFKLISKNNSDWHASDLTINMIGNGDWYHKAAWNTGLKIIDSCHSDDNL
eukprot:430180_1